MELPPAFSALLADYAAAAAAYDRLAAAADPEATPYASKYAARALLPPLIARAEALLRDSASSPSSSAAAGGGAAARARLRDVQAQCHARLGANLVQTEENQAGEAHLAHALAWLLARLGVPREQGPAAFPRAVAHAEAAAMSSLGGARGARGAAPAGGGGSGGGGRRAVPAQRRRPAPGERRPARPVRERRRRPEPSEARRPRD